MPYQLPHFVSASTHGERCVCGKPATHKLGEEIPSDEPCASCGMAWRYREAGGEREVSDPGPCRDVYHHYRHANRHNLTSYVCCFHWTMILGPATGCPLSDGDMRALAEFRRAHVDDGNIFAPPVELFCPSCNGKLKCEGGNPTNMMIGCTSCGLGCFVENVDAKKEA